MPLFTDHDLIDIQLVIVKQKVIEVKTAVQYMQYAWQSVEEQQPIKGFCKTGYTFKCIIVTTPCSIESNYYVWLVDNNGGAGPGAQSAENNSP